VLRRPASEKLEDFLPLEFTGDSVTTLGGSCYIGQVAGPRPGLRTFLSQEPDMLRSQRSGLTLVSVVLSVLLVPVAAHFAWVAISDSEPSDAAPKPGDLQVALIRAGLDADSLAASGLSAEQTTDAVGAFALAMAAEPGRLAEADASYSVARVQTDQLRRKVRSGLGSDQDVSDLAQAKAALEAAESAREATLKDWFFAGTASLSDAQSATLAMIRSNRHWKLPIELLTVERSEAEWVSVRKALANERICAKYSDPADPACQTALSDWRSAPACASAKASCDANATAIMSAWSSATGG